VSLTVNAVQEAWNRRPKALAHAGRLADAASLDLVAAGWAPTADNYLGRVSKARILEAVREANGEPSVELIAHLKKADMVVEAERLLDGTGWLPEPLRTANNAGKPAFSGPVAYEPAAIAETETPVVVLATDEGGDTPVADPKELRPHGIAAE
jgi:ParB family chromosome partitioning protein